MRQGLILLAHGARDPRWREPFEQGVGGEAHWIESGLAGLRERLPKVTGRPDTMAE